jgi:hypothetical protein
MAIELSTITFTDQDDIVPESGVKDIIVNTGSANTLAGNDRITGTYVYDPNSGNDQSRSGIKNSSTLDTAEGDDIINARGREDGILNTWAFYTGEGNDTITAWGSYNGIVNSWAFSTGKGNDVINANGYDLTGIVNSGIIFDTAEGNDTINAYGYFSPGIVNSGTFSTGEGNDIINAGAREDGIVNTGAFYTADGDDVIYGGGGRQVGISSTQGSILDTGNGNDLISGGSFGIGISNASFTFNTGEGNDTIQGGGGSRGIENEGLISTGNGKDEIIARASGGSYYGGPDDFGPALSNFSTIDTGDDEDIITAIGDIEKGNAAIENGGTIYTGYGDDSIIWHGDFFNSGGVFLGDGNDSIAADTNSPDGGLTNYNGIIDTGNGNDTITSTGVIYNEGTIDTGDGDDSIIVDGGFQSGSSGIVFLGNGNDYFKGFGNGEFSGGNGNDTLELTSGTYTVGVWYTTVTFTKDSSIMIASEFEKLIAGSTTYDFTSLTKGQTITIA